MQLYSRTYYNYDFLSVCTTFGLKSLGRLYLGKTQINLVFLSVCTTFVGTITILEKQTTKLYGNNNYY